MKKTFDNRKEEISRVAQHGEVLFKFRSRGSSTFIDPEYGEFTCNYYSFLKGKSVHPKRRNYEHNSIRARKTLEDGQLQIKELGLEHLCLIEWDGLSTGVALFLDNDYGEFSAIYRDVLRGACKHPKRTLESRSKTAIQLWSDENYRSNVIKGLSKSDKASALEKRKKTMLNKYGVEHALQSADIKNKQQSTNVNKYGVLHYAQTEEFKDWFSERNPFTHSGDTVYKARKKTGHIYTFSGKTMSEYADSLGKAYTIFQSQVKKHGIDIALQITRRVTSLELKMESILNSIGVNFESQVAIGEYIADFKIGQLIIEVDGLFWHSDYNIKDKLYHKKKKQTYTNLGYESLFFREHEILNQESIVVSIIKNRLQMSKRLYARNTNLVEVDKKTSKDFFNKNHLMGAGGGRSFGLQHNGELVTLMQIRQERKGIKIERFCHFQETTVVGAYSKLLKSVKSKYNPSFIINFIDKRYGSGKHLENYGFKKESEYVSFAWTDNQKCFHRMNYPGNSGYEIGLQKIWDCGQAKYVWFND